VGKRRKKKPTGMAKASNNKHNCRKHTHKEERRREREREREREWKGCEGRPSSSSSLSFLIHISSIL
jgi:hypothetical protein